ncbi:MAG: hypothetical protein HY914_15060 [Desulfomonile tiedjei]|nr:hypothetical protein [Desulfomonile tiedjei]
MPTGLCTLLRGIKVPAPGRFIVGAGAAGALPLPGGQQLGPGVGGAAESLSPATGQQLGAAA